jgi:hypothetical protein
MQRASPLLRRLRFLRPIGHGETTAFVVILGNFCIARGTRARRHDLCVLHWKQRRRFAIFYDLRG